MRNPGTSSIEVRKVGKDVNEDNEHYEDCATSNKILTYSAKDDMWNDADDVWRKRADVEEGATFKQQANAALGNGGTGSIPAMERRKGEHKNGDAKPKTAYKRNGHGWENKCTSNVV